MKKIAAVLGALAVILGALGAHSLREVLDVDSMDSFKTATMYQLFHAIALIAIPNQRRFRWTARFWVAGILLFSFSIYLLVFDDLIGWDLFFLGPITPIGGLCLIVGWGMLWFAWPNNSRDKDNL
jgi:uncharacterized membrane protein YgdD (TMEM256/DUF423 family)